MERTEWSNRELTLRPGRADDAEDLFALARHTELAAYGHIFDSERHPFPDRPIRERWRRRLQRPSADMDIIVACAGEEIVGVVVAVAGKVENLLVRPDRWRNGIGLRLLDAALEGLRERGYREATLDVLKDNIRARRFYERCGWRLDGRQRPAEFPPHPAVLGYSIDLTAPGSNAT